MLVLMTFARARNVSMTSHLAQIKRRTNIVGTFSNEASITRLVGSMMLEQSDYGSLNQLHIQLKRLQTLCDTKARGQSAVAH